MNLALSSTHQNHGCFADMRRSKIPSIGDFRIEPQVAPGSTFEDVSLLSGEDVRLVVDPVVDCRRSGSVGLYPSDGIHFVSPPKPCPDASCPQMRIALSIIEESALPVPTMS